MKLIKSILEYILSKLFPFNDVTAITPGQKRSKMALISIQDTMEDMRPKL